MFDVRDRLNGGIKHIPAIIRGVCRKWKLATGAGIPECHWLWQCSTLNPWPVPMLLLEAPKSSKHVCDCKVVMATPRPIGWFA